MEARSTPLVRLTALGMWLVAASMAGSWAHAQPVDPRLEYYQLDPVLQHHAQASCMVIKEVDSLDYGQYPLLRLLEGDLTGIQWDMPLCPDYPLEKFRVFDGLEARGNWKRIFQTEDAGVGYTAAVLSTGRLRLHVEPVGQQPRARRGRPAPSPIGHGNGVGPTSEDRATISHGVSSGMVVASPLLLSTTEA